jgi:capsular exopolysaccharide synthesis family protein
VTSPDTSDGKSTLSANLAVSIAQAEKKVILIDADFRRPRVHKLFNLSAEKGLASVMTGEAQFIDVIQATTIPGLSVLTCGPIPPNPAELLTLPLFKEMLASLREKFDYVLIDTPPLLAVTDPCTVAPYVDGVLLTIRISKNARPNALRAKEMLSALGAHVIGVVVNGVRTDAKGYGYGGYGYDSKYYHTYSNYESDASSSSDAGREEDKQAATGVDTPKRQRSVSRRSSRKKTGFFTWLFGL